MTPPQAIEHEQAVIGALLLGGDEVYIKMIPLTYQAFYRREHKLIFKAITNLFEQKKSVDRLIVEQYLKDKGKLEEVGGFSYLGELANVVYAVSHINTYAQVVHEKHMLRELLQASNDISTAILKPDIENSADILDMAQEKIFAIGNKANEDSGPVEVSKVLSLAIGKIEARQNMKDGISGLSTGFKDLDDLTNGLQPGELIIVAGRPSMGKTSFGMNIAEYVAIKGDKAVMVFSMEMSIEDLGIRMISSIGRIDQNRLRSNRMRDEDWARLPEANTAFQNARFFFEEKPILSHHEIRTKARQLAREQDLGLIVIDYLTMMSDPPRCHTKAEAVAENTRYLKALAKELKVPIILLSQLNRNLDGRPDKRPIMSDLRDSGGIEQDADVIMFVYRDDVYNEESSDRGMAEIIVAKNRNGPTGTVKLNFVGHCTRFDNLTNYSKVV